MFVSSRLLDLRTFPRGAILFGGGTFIERENFYFFLTFLGFFYTRIEALFTYLAKKGSLINSLPLVSTLFGCIE